MNPLFSALRTNDALTANGAVTHSTSGSYALDLFFAAGASRGKDISDLFVSALRNDADTAIRIIQWMRDVRGGAGERQQFINLMKVLADIKPEWANKVLMNTPEIGRWKDVAVLGTEVSALRNTALGMFAAALANGDGLAAKWAPRKGVFASGLAKAMNLDKKGYRKMIVGLSNTVEQMMCSNRWNEIDFGKLPSVASSMYQKSFWKHAEENYRAYIASLVNGTAKVNAGAIYPYQIIEAANKMQSDDAWKFAEAQWNALPDYIGNTNRNLLCVVDVSGSMESKINSITYDNNGLRSSAPRIGTTSCMDVAISLGLYVSERMEGPFKNMFITFDDRPSFVDLTGCLTLESRYRKTKRANWGGSTNINRTFQIILDAAVRDGISEKDMPTDLIIFSDMEFNECDYNSNLNNFEAIDRMYSDAGYTRPNLIFWNIRCYRDNHPVRFTENGTALVSGLSPSVMKAILSGDASEISPMKIMKDAISDPRYLSVV